MSEIAYGGIIHAWHGSSVVGRPMGLCGLYGHSRQHDIFHRGVTCPHCLAMLKSLNLKRE